MVVTDIPFEALKPMFAAMGHKPLQLIPASGFIVANPDTGTVFIAKTCPEIYTIRTIAVPNKPATIRHTWLIQEADIPVVSQIFTRDWLVKSVLHKAANLILEELDTTLIMVLYDCNKRAAKMYRATDQLEWSLYGREMEDRLTKL